MFYRGLFLDHFFSLSTVHWYIVLLLPSPYLTTSTLMILSCIFPSQLITQNSLSITYSNALSLFRTGWLPTNPDKTDFLLIGHECQRIKYLSTFSVTPSKSVKNLGIVVDENFKFQDSHQQHLQSFLLSYLWPVQNQKTFEPGPSQVPGICPYVQSAWLLQLPAACMVSQLGTCSSSRECRTLLPEWSPGLVALHPAPSLSLSPLVTHSL